MSSSVVQRLRDHLDNNPEFKAHFEKAFEEAFKKAKNSGVHLFEEWGITNLDEYLHYCDSFLKWVPTETQDGTHVYNHICIFYFVLDQPDLDCYRSVIEPATHSPYTWLSGWIIDYAKEMGKWMDSPESITEATIDTFYRAESYHMDDYDRKPWKTFNEFFARHIKPERRPIDRPNDDTVIVSPADAKFDGHWPVDDCGNVRFCAKGIPWSIEQLLDERCEQLRDDPERETYSAKFTGGTFCHSFLGPNDYHRQHAPVSGIVREARVIEGLCYLEVVVEPNSDGVMRLGMRRKMHPRTAEPRDSIMNAPDHPGYQFIQARGLIIIDNPVLGHVAVLPIGMAQVSSVVLSVKKDDVVKKGDEISYFQLGGSDIVMVFEPRAHVDFTAKCNTHYAFGKTVAIASPSESG